MFLSVCQAAWGVGWGFGGSTRLRGDQPCSCWWVCCRIRGSSGPGSVTARTRPIWWRASTECCDSWGARPGGGGCVRMSTVLVPGTERIQASFVGVARHYGVGIDACPPRRPNRKGVVSKTYLDNDKWIARVIEQLSTREGFREATGRDPLTRNIQPTNRRPGPRGPKDHPSGRLPSSGSSLGLSLVEILAESLYETFWPFDGTNDRPQASPEGHAPTDRSKTEEVCLYGRAVEPIV